MLKDLGVATVDAQGNMLPLENIMQDLSKSLEGMGTADKADIINTIFNKQDIAAVNALLDTSADRWKELSEAIDDSKGAASEMVATQLDNLAGDITLFKFALEGAQIAVSDGLTPTLREFVQFGTSGLSKITEAFEKGGITGAMEAFGTVLSDGLNMIIEKIPDFINAGMELLGALGQGILDNLPVIVDAAVQVVVMLAQGFVTALPELVKGFITLIEALKTSLSENAEPLLEAGKTLLTYIWEGISTGLPEFVANAYAAIPGIIEQITAFIKEHGTDFIGAGLDLMHDLIQGILESFPDIIAALTDLVIEMALTLTDPTNLAKMIETAGEIIMALANGLLEAIPKLLDALPQIISNLVGALIAAIPQIIAVGLQLIVALATGLIQAIPRLVAAIPALITAIVGGLVKGVKAIKDVGKDMIEGLWRGIKERWEGMVRDFKNLASGFVDGVKRLFGIHSPSRVFAEIGKYIDEGLALGIIGNVNIVDSAMDKLTDFDANMQIDADPSSGSASVLSQVAATQNENRNLTVILELDKMQLGRAVYQLNNAETQRVGVKLAGGYA